MFISRLYGVKPLDVIKLSKIEGYLQAFANLNTRADHGFQFCFIEIPYENDLLECFEKSNHLDEGKKWNAKLNAVLKWKDTLKIVCDRWFFDVGYPMYKDSQPLDYMNDFMKEYSIDGFINLLTDFLK